jgi:hypothetical protein
MLAQDESSNFQLFRDCLSNPIITQSAEKSSQLRGRRKGRRNAKRAIKPVISEKGDDDDARHAEELAEFIDVRWRCCFPGYILILILAVPCVRNI